MLIHLIQTIRQYVVPTKSYKRNKLLMRRKWHTAINSVVYNSSLKHDINVQFSLTGLC